MRGRPETRETCAAAVDVNVETFVPNAKPEHKNPRSKFLLVGGKYK